MDKQVATQFTFLVWGFSAGWALIFAYLLWIAQKERTLRHKIGELQEAMEEHWKRKKA